MNFTSASFLLFFPLVLLLFRVVQKRRRWILLLAASWAFYVSWNPWTGILLFLATVCSYLAGLMIEKGRMQEERHERHGHRNADLLINLWTVIGIGVPLSCLIVFKYAGFFTDTASAFFDVIGIGHTIQLPRFVLPIGISFYTFQTLSYVIDVRRGTISAEKHFGFYALYISFFPQLVAGPIERPGNLIPQLRSVCGVRDETGLHAADEKRQPGKSREDLSAGFYRMLLGFFKKLVVADYLASFVEPVYAAPGSANGPAVIIATVLFAIQIYCDFSGYSDIACGSARMLGIRLTENFRLPYMAESLHKFWRRWHISLTSWLTDYIYIPLGGSQRGTMRQLINTMIVFAVSGLWHGASWTFVIWGLIHGAAMCFETIAVSVKKDRLHEKNAGKASSHAAFHRILTFLFVCFTWIFFRAATLPDAMTLILGLARGYSLSGVRDAASVMGITGMELLHIILAVLCLGLIEKSWSGDCNNGSALNGDPAKAQEEVALFIIITVLVIAASWLLLLAQHAGNVFIYFQF